MRKKLTAMFISLLLVSYALIVCSSDQPTEVEKPPARTNDFLVDSLATSETIALYEKLDALKARGVLFGHQDDTAYGVGWWDESRRSDVKSVCGDYPAVYGWDLGDIHQEQNLDGVNFEKMKNWIREAHARGGVITISMHLDNPVTGENAWDNTVAVKSILPNGSHHDRYLETLDRIAAFLQDLEDSGGKHIPVLFRPYHEHNHTWSWWGAGSCTVQEYNDLWRMTVEHLRDHHQLHNLLYTISPQEVYTEEKYLERYPGDEYVDILGMDYYRLTNPSSIKYLGQALSVIASLAESRGKISALTEVGAEKVPISDWWTNYLLAAIKHDSQSQKTVWALVWRNASEEHHFAPYPGHSSARDFQAFHDDPFTLFEQDLAEAAP